MRKSKMLTLRQTAERLQLGESQTRRLCRAGKLKGARKIMLSRGEEWRIPRISVEARRRAQDGQIG